MGITVISAPAASAASTASASAPSATTASIATDSIPIDFAALLTSQIAGLPLAANKVANTNPVLESKEDADKDGDLIRDMLLAQDPAQNVIANIPPALENRLQIDVDRNSRGTANSPANVAISELGDDTKNTGLLNTSLKPKDAGPERTQPEAAPPAFNAPTKADTNFAQAAQAALSAITQPSLSAIAQKPIDITAIIAGETNTGNTTPSTFASLLTSQAAQAQQTQPTSPSNNPTVATPIQDNRWSQDFSERIVWVAKNDQQVAQINITPAQLGPVQITLNMNGDQASIAFASPHAEVRKAIEDAMPNLREMLSTAGISLGQSNVGAQLQQQQRDTNPQLANGNRSAGETAILPADSRSGSISTGLPIQRGRGLVDLFA